MLRWGLWVSFFMNQTLSEELVACQVPATCSDDIIPTPTEESGLVFLNLSSSIIAYRFATYACNDTYVFITLFSQILKFLFVIFFENFFPFS